jgi:toxin ParE1/3/4
MNMNSLDSEASFLLLLMLPEETVVIAVAHHSRKPGYWLGRSKP